MYIVADTLDDLMREVLEKLLKEGVKITASKGNNLELGGVLLELRNPRSRLSRTEVKGTLFSCLGECLWYLSGSNELRHIQHYIPIYDRFSDDGLTAYGAYGPRLFNMRGGYNQVENVISILRKKPTSRQAVIQLFDARDIVVPHKDVPCTCSIQFMIRNSKLDVFATMRSNDVFLGFPHDVFAFTMIQELVARTLGKDVGTYKHSVGSMHVYDDDLEKVTQYLEEGWQEKISMPEMPEEDPWISVRKLVDAEVEIRSGRMVDIATLGLDSYWQDLIRLLQIYSGTIEEARTGIKLSDIEKDMICSVYNPYIRKRQARAKS